MMWVEHLADGWLAHVQPLRRRGDGAEIHDGAEYLALP